MSDEAKPKVAREVAEAEFQRWAAAMSLERTLDPSKFDDADKRGFAQVRELLLGAMEDGSLVVDPEGQFVFTPTIGDVGPLTFYEPDGAVLKARDQAKDPGSIEAEHKILAAMTKTSPTRFAKMKARDLKICKAALVLFLA